MDETLLRRTMPHDIEMERAVIGSMLMNSAIVEEVAVILTAADFYGRQYAILFQAICDMYNSGKPIDLLTLQSQLKTMDVPEDLSSIDFIRELLDSVAHSGNALYYAQDVKDKSTLRKLIKYNEEISNACYAGQEEVKDILEGAEQKIYALSQEKKEKDFTPIRQLVISTMENIEAATKTSGTVTGIPSGFPDLDYMTSGFHNSDFILVGARPAMGKTAFVLNVAEYMAVKKNVTVAIFSLEMSDEQLVTRLFAMESHVNSQKLRSGDLEDSDWERLIESANMIGNSNLIIADTPNISIGELRSKCRKYKADHDLGIVIIDYLQLMTGGGRSESRQQEISAISRSLKGLARELNIPIIALSQLSRDVEKRPDHRPMLSDLRESGAIEQDADMVMFLYRDDYYNKESDKKNVAEVIIAKQRNGSIGTVELAWLPDYTKFASIERKKYDN